MISVVLVVGDGDLVDGVGNFIVVVVDNSLAEVVFPSVVVVMTVDDGVRREKLLAGLPGK